MGPLHAHGGLFAPQGLKLGGATPGAFLIHPGKAMKIAADGSNYTKRMLAYIAAHDEWLGSKHQYKVFHCFPALPHRAAAFAGQSTVHSCYVDDAETMIRPIRAFFKVQSLEATFVHEIGAPAQGIARLAERGKFDLLLLGSHGQGALANLVLGSVATKVWPCVRRLYCW